MLCGAGCSVQAEPFTLPAWTGFKFGVRIDIKALFSNSDFELLSVVVLVHFIRFIGGFPR